MTTKPDDIPQNVMDASELAFFQIKAEYIGLGLDASPVFVIARAILKAKNDAYEECAKMVGAASPVRDAFETEDEDGIRWPQPAVQMPIYQPENLAQAIRNLKHETEV